MKKVLFLAFFGLLTGLAFGQTRKPSDVFGDGKTGSGGKSTGTSLEEYNYVTKGYKVQLESGLDMKKGYSFKDLGAHEFVDYGKEQTVVLKSLMKEGETKPRAVMLIYYITKNPTKRLYFCIPSSDADDAIWDMAKKTIYDLRTEQRSAIAWALMKLSTDLLSK